MLREKIFHLITLLVIIKQLSNDFFMWGNGRRMEFVRDAKILRRNFVIDILSYEVNLCCYAIHAIIQQRLINISTKE
ncbi:hypothetical protein ZEAMMB73_Zm00001d047073 [Zea mays]|uniref:Uncharacterized protein n=1 Tax=Zea mays TaxID=4577 RepID=A0A1D6P6R1_MAIZE|nr:hypothetical protein ZEAMMB73_Zm00001d047073 [Zea mays]